MRFEIRFNKAKSEFVWIPESEEEKTLIFHHTLGKRMVHVRMVPIYGYEIVAAFDRTEDLKNLEETEKLNNDTGRSGT